MSARKKNYHRHPRTTQERRESQGKNFYWIRPSRRANNLPNAWDDYCAHRDNCWKNKRKTQYRCANENWQWRVIEYDYRYFNTDNLISLLEKFGCYYNWKFGGRIEWFGPDLVKW